MITYSLNVALIIAVSLVFYRTFLQKETFFKLNRAILLSCIILSFIIPLIHVPASFSFRNPVMPIVNTIEYNTITNNDKAALYATPQTILNNSNPTTHVSFFQTAAAYGLKYVPYIYWAGVVIMGLNFLLQILVLKFQQYKSQIIKDGMFRIIEIADDRAPCSFANYIYINPEKYDWQTYNQILQHEKIHVLQGHSFDLIFTEILLTFQWFNPFAWLFRKDIENNLEYLTDDTLLRQNEFEKSDYQMNLVKVSVPNFAMNITTNYNQSLLKKRIMMMNAKRSNAHKMWKYITLVLILGVIICNINEPLAALPYNAQLSNAPLINVNNATGATNGRSGQKRPKAITATVLNTPRPVITNSADSELSKNNGVITNTDTIKKASGITPEYIKGLRSLGFANLSTDNIILAYRRNINADFIKDIQNLGYKDVSFNQFMLWKLQGIDAGFIKGFINTGLTIPVSDISLLKFRNIPPVYINDMQNLGYKDVSVNQFMLWKLQGIDASFVKGFNKIGFNNIPIKDISYLKQSNITPEYVAEMKESGINYDDLKRYVALKNIK
jgi:hypothetical protein